MPGSLSFRQGMKRELLAAIVLEDLGIFLRDFFQRFQAIGRESGSDDGDAPHAFPGQPLHGLVGVGLEPLVEAEARLERQQQFRGVEAHALAQAFRRRDALHLIGIALVDIFLRHAVERGHDDFGLKRQARQMRVDRDRQRLDVIGIVVIRRRHPQRRLRAHLAQHAEHLVANGRRWSRPNIADRAARPASGRSPAPSARRSARRSTDCRSASPSRP